MFFAWLTARSRGNKWQCLEKAGQHGKFTGIAWPWTALRISLNSNCGQRALKVPQEHSQGSRKKKQDPALICFDLLCFRFSCGSLVTFWGHPWVGNVFKLIVDQRSQWKVKDFPWFSHIHWPYKGKLTSQTMHMAYWTAASCFASLHKELKPKIHWSFGMHVNYCAPM